MSVSQAETSAFLNAQNKVTAYLQKFMNGSGWFHDSPIPQDVRADVDGPLKNLYGVLAEELKEALLIWDAKNNPPEANLFFDTLRAFSAGMQAGEEIATQFEDTMKTLTTGERVFSGIGFGVGKIVKEWKGVSTAAISAEGKATSRNGRHLTAVRSRPPRNSHPSQWGTLPQAPLTTNETLESPIAARFVD